MWNDDDEELEEFELADYQHRVSFVSSLTPSEFERMVKQAMEIWIATAYVNSGGIENLVATLKQRGSTAKVNFLLSSKFAPMDHLKEMVIRELSDIPNSEIRVTDSDSAFFHPKVYVFVEGNIATVIVGSMNLTKAGLEKNIEAGIKITEVREKEKLHEDALKFIQGHWVKAKVTKPNPEFKIPNHGQKYHFRNRVSYKPTQEKGVVMDVNLVNGEWIYDIFIGDEKSIRAKEDEIQLETVSILAGSGDIIENIIECSTTSEDFTAYLIHRKLTDVAMGSLFSYQSSRTKHYDFQFIPLMKMLSENKHGILIADEVGLGKTIEAAIILKELSTRAGGFQRCVILAPKNLCHKWELELRGRFDEYFDIGTLGDLKNLRESFIHDDSKSCRLIIPFSQIQRSKDKTFFEMFDVPIDIVVVDEAHWMRNSETNLYKNALHLLTISKHVVFLTATPVNTGLMNILPLLRILDYETFGTLDEVGFRTLMSPMNIFMKCFKIITDADVNSIRKTLKEVQSTIENEICSHRKFVRYYSDNKHFKELLIELNRLELSEISITDKDLLRVRYLLLKLNPINAVVSRTRKIDVPEIKNVIRNPVTLLVDATSSEQNAYEQIKAIKSNIIGVPSAFGSMQPERVASSCLPIAIERYIKGECLNQESFNDSSFDYNDEDYDTDTTFDNMPENPQNITDTKYERLKTHIDSILQDNGTSQTKILLFSSFVGTVEYLKARLLHDFGPEFAETMSGLTPFEERNRLQKKFRDNINPSILLCTEVASEGLDFQFCNVLVNYDLPWNPMKIEQRIGRIDRIGQESDTIYIVNLIVKNTIDEIIYDRVAKRVIEIRSTIGPLSKILGRIENNLVPQLLQPGTSNDEREWLLREYNASVERALETEKEFEERRTSLVGLDPFFSDEISMTEKNRKFFIVDECRFILNRFLRRTNQEYDESSSLIDSTENEISTLFLDSRAKSIIAGRIASCSLVSPKRKDALLDKIKSNEPIKVTFNQDSAMKHLDTEFLTVHHPILLTELMNYLPESYSHCASLEFQESDKIGQGDYLFIVFPITIEDSAEKKIKTVYYNMELYSLETKKPLLPELASFMYSRLLNGDCVRSSMNFQNISSDFQECHEQAISNLEPYLQKIKREPTDIVRSQAIVAHFRVIKEE